MKLMLVASVLRRWRIQEFENLSTVGRMVFILHRLQ